MERSSKGGSSEAGTRRVGYHGDRIDAANGKDATTESESQLKRRTLVNDTWAEEGGCGNCLPRPNGSSEGRVWKLDRF